MFYGGIDVAKYRHEICIQDETGNTVLQMHMDNIKKGLDKLLLTLEKPDIAANGIEFCLGATGHYWLALYCHLHEWDYPVHVINPIQSDALHNLYVRKTKTDTKDAVLLADLLRMDQTSKSELASETTLKLQTLSRTRFDFVRQVGWLKNQVLAILDRIFPEYAHCFSNVFIQTSRQLLKEYPEPEELAAVELTELTHFLNQHSRGRLAWNGPYRFRN